MNNLILLQYYDVSDKQEDIKLQVDFVVRSDEMRERLEKVFKHYGDK